jgi:cation diffusion facilitator family transporter
VLIGVGGVFFGISFLEPLATIAISAVIIKVAVDIFKSSVNQLIDRSVDKETIAEIEKITRSVEGVIKIDILRTRQSGGISFVDIEIAVNPDITVTAAHAIAQNVHDRIEAASLGIQHCMVHVNPDDSPGQ